MVLDSASSFEKTRITQMREERLDIQKKTFTKWINSFLNKHRLEVEDIFTDLCDGRKLLKLLEIISNEKLGKPNPPNKNLRVHKIENVNKCLNFLATKIKIELIGAEDIVDGNKKLILGLVWTIILRFLIQDISIDDEENNAQKGAKHSAKDALLLWCRMKTKGYKHVDITDFTNSWRDGMAFNALIHSQRPELVDYDQLDPKNAESNLRNAFETARKNLAIEPLLDVEDIVETVRPDERSILTYVSSYYHSFAKFQKEVVSGKRINNTVSQLMEINRCQLNYEMYTTNLLNWIELKCFELNKRDFPNSSEEIQKLKSLFKEYLSVEKPPKYRERSEIEALFFQISTKMKVMRYKVPYKAPEGKLIKDIHRAWTLLERAEHQRELAINNEMIRLENLQHIADKFDKKSRIRRAYIEEKIRVLQNTPFESAIISQVDATVKMHESIRLDVLSRSHKIDELSEMIKSLEDGKYYRVSGLVKALDEIKALWERMWTLLKSNQSNLSLASALVANVREMTTVQSELQDMINHLDVDGHNSNHLKAVQEFMQNHSLQEAQILSQGDVVRRLISTASKLLQDPKVLSSPMMQSEVPKLKESNESLNRTYNELKTKSKAKTEQLAAIKEHYQMLQDIEEEESSIVEKKNICQAILPGRDLLAIIGLQQKHNVLEAELQSHETRLKQMELKSQQLKDKENSEIVQKLEKAKQNLQAVKVISQTKSKELSDATEAFQYHADANETQSWLIEKLQLARSEDYGMDEPSALSLLQRHSRLENEVKAYQHDIERINKQSDKMITSGVDNFFLLASEDPLLAAPVQEDVYEVIEKEIVKEVYKEIERRRVQVLYNFERDGFRINKGEYLILNDMTTVEWWSVSRFDDPRKGFVPANYVREIEPITERILIQTPVKIKEKVKKKPSGNQRFPMRNPKRSNRRLSIVSGVETVGERKNRINQDYENLLTLCDVRRRILEETVKLYQFENECQALSEWMDTCHQSLTQVRPTNSDSLIKQYETIITDSLANKQRLERIQALVQQTPQESRYLPVIQKRFTDILRRWRALEELQKKFAKDIEGLTTIEMFNTKCDDAIERMGEKLARIEVQQSFPELKSVQDFKRKHESIKRELMPIEEDLKRIQIISDNLKSSQPEHRAKVEERLGLLYENWNNLTKASLDKEQQLDKIMGLQILQNSSTDLLSWLRNYVQPELVIDLENTDLKSNLLNIDSAMVEHDDLFQQFEAKSEEISQLSSLSAQLAEKVPAEELAIIQELIEEYNMTWSECAKKVQFLEQCKMLGLFNHECDKLEALLSHNLSDLSMISYGDSIDSVMALRKRHQTFMATLRANEARVHKLLDDGKKLVDRQHFDSVNIAKRIESVGLKRKQAMDKAIEVEKLLKSSHVYHEIKADADELLNWCSTKAEMIDENELKEMSNMQRKHKKHQRFEAEVRVHLPQLEKLERIIDELILNESEKSEELRQIRLDITEAWRNLIAKIDAKSKLFNQVNGQIEFSKNLLAIKQRVSEIDNLITTEDNGSDRRSNEQQIVKQKSAVNDLNILEDRLRGLELKNNEIAEDHLNRDDILLEYSQLMEHIQALKEPLSERELALQQANQFFQHQFDIDAERQWIKDYKTRMNHFDNQPKATSESQALLKKFEKNMNVLSNHYDVAIKPLIKQCQNFIENTPETEQNQSQSLQEQIGQLENDWNELRLQVDTHHSELKKTDEKLQFVEECETIQSWIHEKVSQLSAGTFSRDEQMITKLLQKQKQNDLEIDTYKGLIDELTERNAPANDLADSKDSGIVSEDPIFKEKTAMLADSLKKVTTLNKERTQDLIEIKRWHEFENEFQEHMQFIDTQSQAFLSEEFGKDYEHCVLLQSKFRKQKAVILDHEERIRACIDFGESLIKNLNENNKKYEISQIRERSKALEAKFNDLIERMNVCEENFQGAIEIHRFNRDIVDTYDRLLEKYEVFKNADLGRDTHSVSSLLRKHDLFQNDLVALEAQLQVLIHDSIPLRQKYPGDNAKEIQDKINQSVELYNKIKDLTEQRTIDLKISEQYFRFLSQVRDWNAWAELMIAEMKPCEAVSDVQASKALKNNHDRLMDDIRVRQRGMEQIYQQAGQFTDTRYQEVAYQANNSLMATRDELENTSLMRKAYLDQLIDQNCFTNDIKNLEHIYQQNLILLNIPLSSDDSLEYVNRMLKKHQEFVRVFDSTTVAKYVKLESCAKLLIEKLHPNAKAIGENFDSLTVKHEQVVRKINERTEELNDIQTLATFKLECSEAHSWIDEKQLQIQTLKASSQPKEAELAVAEKEEELPSLESKMKRLQRHQVLDVEINANSQRFKQIDEMARHLINKNHSSAILVRTEKDELFNRWQQLLASIRNALEVFEEEKDYYEFCQNVDQISSWIRDKQVMIQVGDVGNDYEHCEALLRKLDDVDSDMRVDESKLKKINDLTNSLIRKQNSASDKMFSVEQVTSRRSKLLEDCQELQNAISQYRNTLQSARVIHSLNRDLDEISERIAEKEILVNAQHEAKSLYEVEALKRKHEALRVDIFTIETMFAKINDAQGELSLQSFPQIAEIFRSKLQSSQNSLRKLQDSYKVRGIELKNSHLVHKFYDAVAQLEQWANNLLKTGKLLNSDTAEVEASTVGEAKQLLALHEDLKTEISSKREQFATLKEYGSTIAIQFEHENSNDTVDSGDQKTSELVEQINNRLNSLEELRKELNSAWDERHKHLKECLDLQLFNELYKLCDSWISRKEAILNNEDYGTTLDEVETLIKRHQVLVNSLSAEQRLSELIEMATSLKVKNHFDIENIEQQSKSMTQRREKLFELSAQRSERLNQSKSYFQFLRNHLEITRWLTNKLAVAHDQNYRDLMNLLSKKQRHAAFEAEIAAFKERIDVVVSEGEQLISKDNFRSEDVQRCLDELNDLEHRLQQATTLKKMHLNEACEMLLFSRSCEDLTVWLAEVERLLSEKDRGTDLTSIRLLIKKQERLESDVQEKGQMFEGAKNQLEYFQSSNYYLPEEIVVHAGNVFGAYSTIHGPLVKRREVLEESLVFFQFKHDIKHEINWLSQKDSQFTQFERSNLSLADVQRLFKRLKAVEQEVNTKESTLSSLVSKGHSLIKQGGYNTEEIKDMTLELQNKFQHVKDKAQALNIKLADLLSSREFLGEINEAQGWIDERSPMLAIREKETVIQDEETLLTEEKKLDLLKIESDRFASSTVARLQQMFSTFVEKEHLELEMIRTEMDILTRKFELFVEQINAQIAANQIGKKYCAFVKDANDFERYIATQMTVSRNEDYGNDVEHVTKLIQQFENFIASLSSNEEKLEALKKAGENIPNVSVILENLESKCKQLREENDHRSAALLEAKKVHLFYQSADETSTWVRQKLASNVLENVSIESADLYSIQSKIHELEGFTRELQAVGQQVEDLFKEANHLSENVPDIKQVIEDKSASVREDWQKLLEARNQQDHNLKQVEKIRSYFDEYHEMVTWLREIMFLVTSETSLAIDAPSAEEQLNRHKEYKVEIDARKEAVAIFLESGHRILESGHFMSRDVQERNLKIDNDYKLLLSTWQERAILFEHNISARQYLLDAQAVDKWITQQTPYLQDENLGNSIAEVEEMISQFSEFENTLDNQQEKLNMVSQITALEKHFEELVQRQKRLEEEEAQRAKEAALQKQKEEEKARILRERKYQEQGIYENSNFHDKSRQKPSSPSQNNVSKLLRKSSFNILGGRKQPSPTPDLASSLKLKPVQEEYIAHAGFLDVKQIETDGRGKVKTVRTWKSFYTVLCGQLLCFFKDENAFKNSQAAVAPVSILNSMFKQDNSHKKKRFIFCLEPQSQRIKYLFAAPNEEQLKSWMSKISFRASLAPSEQLLNPAVYAEKSVDAHFVNPQMSVDSNPNVSPGTSKPSSRRSSVSSSQQKSLSSLNGHFDPLYENQVPNRNGHSHPENGDFADQKSIANSDLFRENNPEYQNLKYMSLPPMNRQSGAKIAEDSPTVSSSDLADSQSLASVDNQSVRAKNKSRLSFLRKKKK